MIPYFTPCINPKFKTYINLNISPNPDPKPKTRN